MAQFQRPPRDGTVDEPAGSKEHSPAETPIIRINTTPLPASDEATSGRASRASLAQRLDAKKTVDRRTRFLIVGLIWVVIGIALIGARLVGWVGPDKQAPTTSLAVTTTTTTPTTTVSVTTLAQVAFVIEVRSTRGSTPISAQVDGKPALDEVLERDQTVLLEGDVITLRIAKPSMVRLVVNGKTVAGESEMTFGP